MLLCHISRVSDQNGISLQWRIVEIYLSGQKPSISLLYHMLTCTTVSHITGVFHSTPASCRHLSHINLVSYIPLDHPPSFPPCIYTCITYYLCICTTYHSCIMILYYIPHLYQKSHQSNTTPVSYISAVPQPCTPHQSCIASLLYHTEHLYHTLL